MFHPRPNRPHPSAATGFTLIEVLVVVGIMAAIAGTALGLYYETAEETKEELVRVQMSELAQALQRFRQDTGYYPREGPFSLVPSGTSETTSGSGLACAGVTGGGAGVPRTPFGALPNLDSWFASPANLLQLMERPDLCRNHPQHYLANQDLPKWDPATRRGWRGPYLRKGVGGILYADIGDNLLSDGSGNPTLGTALVDVPALPAPRERSPVQPGSYANCASAPTNSACLLDFRAAAGMVNSLNAAGRPLLFILAGTDTRIVHFGADGRYDGPNACLPPLNSDDLVTCLPH